MPVSYRYHSYSPQKPTPSRKLRARAKQQLTESELASHHTASEEGLHYGHRFAETEERAHERAHERAEHPRPAPKMSRPQQQREERRGMPIGALPETEEPIAQPDTLLEAGREPRVNDLVSEAMRNVQQFTSAIRDLGEASVRLARFPLDAARALRGRKNR